MIEFALLFGLGFLSAALVAILIAPAIHRRIVRYTENRIQSTMPISPQEVRAQRDMARAVYAAENARIQQDLILQRERNTALQLRADSLSQALKNLEGEKLDLKMQSDRLDSEASDARSLARQEESQVVVAKAALAETEATLGARDAELIELRQTLSSLTANSDNMRIDLSSRDAEMESLKSRFGNLRDELATLRDDLRQQTGRAKEAEVRLSQEQDRIGRLDQKLAEQMSEGATRAETIDRRDQEILRLREKLNAATAEAREASRTTRNSKSTAKRAAATENAGRNDRSREYATPMPAPVMTLVDGELPPHAAELAEDARNRATALSERLAKSREGGNDAALRQEMAVIAANLVAVTAAREGRSSPIRTVLAGKSGNGERESLAAKVKKTLASLDESKPS